jgi:hypothetical protein
MASTSASAAKANKIGSGASAKTTAQPTMTATANPSALLKTRRARSGSPAPTAWPTNADAASEMPKPGKKLTLTTRIATCVAATSTLTPKTSTALRTTLARGGDVGFVGVDGLSDDDVDATQAAERQRAHGHDAEVIECRAGELIAA